MIKSAALTSDQREESPATLSTFSAGAIVAKMRNIFILDDSIETTHLLQGFLSQYENIKIHPFNNEYDALRKISKVRPDLLILDIMLSSFDGIRVAKAVKDLKYYTGPILFISAHQEFQRVVERLDYADFYFLQKPISRSMFISQISALLSAL